MSDPKSGRPARPSDGLPPLASEYAAWDACYQEDDPPFKWGALPETTSLITLYRERGFQRLLDAACGDGGQMEPFLDEFLVVGVDQSPQALLAAHRYLRAAGKSNFVLIRGFLENMTFSKGMFDSIILKDVFMMFREPELVLASLHQLLADEGVLVLSTFSTRDMPHYRRLPDATWISGANVCVYGGRFFTRFYDPHELHDILNQCGFAVIEMSESQHDDVPHRNFRDHPHVHERLMVLAERI